MHYKTPELVKDIYWDEIVPPELPHTIASLKCHKTPPGTSTDYIQVSNKEQEIVCLEPTRVTIGKNSVKFRKSGNMAEIVQLLEEQKKECNETIESRNCDYADRITSRDEIVFVESADVLVGSK